MDANTHVSADIQRRQDRKRKRKAILAGGVVLGLGAAVTLAAWSDDVFAGGTFASGSFELQGSTTGTADSFENYDEDLPAVVTFSVPANDLAPGDVVYAPFYLGVDGTRDAAVSVPAVTGTSGSDLNEFLSYEIFESETCDADVTGTAAFSGTVDGAVTTNDDTVTAPQLGETGTNVALCIVVTAAETAEEAAPETFPQGEGTTVTWQFTGDQLDA